MGAIDKHARTGRTTRLLQEARRLSDESRAVYVVVSSESLVKAFSTEEFRRRGIKVETMASLGHLELETMRLRGAHPNSAVLVDHYVIERRFRPMLEMLHRFDLPEERREHPDSERLDIIEQMLLCGCKLGYDEAAAGTESLRQFIDRMKAEADANAFPEVRR
jgi:hypothetical protein